MQFAVISMCFSRARPLVLGLAAFALCAPNLACQSASVETAEAGMNRSEAAALKAQVEALETQLRQLQNRVNSLSRQSQGTTVETVRINSTLPSLPSPPPPAGDAPKKNEPVSRVGKILWSQIVEFRDARNLNSQQTDGLVDIVQKERGALWVILRSETLTPRDRARESVEVRKRTDDAVAALLGDEHGAHWRTLRQSRWGNGK